PTSLNVSPPKVTMPFPQGRSMPKLLGWICRAGCCDFGVNKLFKPGNQLLLRGWMASNSSGEMRRCTCHGSVQLNAAAEAADGTLPSSAKARCPSARVATMNTQNVGQTRPFGCKG